MTDKLTIHDLRKAGFCVTGIRDHYNDLGLDMPFKEFVRNGLDLEVARQIDDAHAKKGVEAAEARIANAKEAD